jgi:hypothetical protein
MSEYIEVNGQEVEKYEYLHTEDGQPRVNVEILGEAIWSKKTKALIILMPQYDNDVPQVINIGLDDKEIRKAIDTADGCFADDTYKSEVEQLEKRVYRLETIIDNGREC